MLYCGVFIDLKKAFDTIDHCIFVKKCITTALDGGIINDWFHSYLTDRVQSTQIGSEVSTKFPTACGVPQGSVLGLYYSFCTSTIYADHLINCRFIYLLMILICYMLIEILIPLKELSMQN